MNKRIDAAQFRAELRAAVDAAGGLRPWARTAGVSAQYVLAVLQGKSPPGSTIADALGYDRDLLFTKRRPPP